MAQGYGQQVPPGGFGAPAAVPEKKGMSTGVKVGIAGCGCLLLLGIVGVALVLVGPALGWFVYQETAPSAAGGGGATCAEAETCCRAVMAKSGGDDSACSSYGRPDMPEASCSAALDGFRKSAKAVGASCP